MDFTDIYRSTEFSIPYRGMDVFFSCEKVSRESLEAMEDSDFCIISASNPQLSQEENEKKHEHLQEILDARELRYSEGVKKYGIEIDKTFVVYGLIESDIRNLGMQFQQTFVLYKENERIRLLDPNPPFLDIVDISDVRLISQTL